MSKWAKVREHVVKKDQSKLQANLMMLAQAVLRKETFRALGGAADDKNRFSSPEARAQRADALARLRHQDSMRGTRGTSMRSRRRTSWLAEGEVTTV